MYFRKRFCLTALAVSLAAGGAQADSPGAALLKSEDALAFSGKTQKCNGVLTVGRLKRRYILNLPLVSKKSAPAGKASDTINHSSLPGSAVAAKLPVIIVLHGALGNAWTAEFDSIMTERAAREGFIVVYPYGTGIGPKQILFWNAGACCSLASLRNVDDVSFMRELIAVLKRDYKADENRIYVAGASNGGMMAYRLAAELSDQIAAIGSVEGCMFPAASSPTAPVSVIEFHGTADSVIPYTGGTGSLMGVKVRGVPSVAKTVDFWIDHDHCNLWPERINKEGVLKETYSGGREGSAVCLVSIEGGGHAWPGGRCAGLWGDKPSLRVNATDEMLTFFKEHPKKQSLKK